MKHIYNFFKLIVFLSFGSCFLVSAYDCYPSVNNAANAKFNYYDDVKSNSQRLSHYALNNRYMNRYACLKRQYFIVVRNKQRIHNNISIIPKVDAAIDQRNKSLLDLIHNVPGSQVACLKKYSLSPFITNFLVSHNIDSAMFETCEGNFVQHALHYEFITLTDTTAHLLHEHKNLIEIKKLTSVVADFIVTGVLSNHNGDIKKAVRFADAGWSILDCIQAVGQGVVQSIYSMGHAVTHPVHTAENFVNAISHCGYYCGLALQEIAGATEALLHGDIERVQGQCRSWGDQCKSIANTFNNEYQQLTVPDLIRIGTRILIESYLTSRAIRGFSNLFKDVPVGSLCIAKKINERAQESILLMSVEGIPLRIARETFIQIKKLPRARNNLLQILSKFKSKKMRIGNVTCLLDKKGLKHILERHHPKYWNGTLATTQTFLPVNMAISDIIKIIKSVIKQNRQLILNKGMNNTYKINGVINNVSYVVGFNRGRIGQFYISSL